MSATWLALVLSIVSAAVAATVVVRSSRREAQWTDAERGVGDGPAVGRIGLPGLLRAAGLAVVLFGVVLVATMAVGQLDLFGVMHLVYDEAVVGGPLAVALILAAVAASRTRGPRLAVTRPAVVVLVVVALLAPLGFYMTHIEPERLEVDAVGPVELPAARAGDAPLRIGVLTDWQLTHVGEHEREAIDLLLAQHPDIVLLPGDVFQDSEEAFARELPAIREQLARLDVPGGAFLVEGDTDPVWHLQAMVEGTKVRFLGDEVVETSVRDRRVTIAGTELAYAAPGARAAVDDLAARPGDDDVRIVLAHRPDVIDVVPPGDRIDLVVTGHTHGGQIAVPFVGPLLTLSGVPRHVAAGGLHELAGTLVYVGRGVGVERGQAPQIRFLVPPNIGVIDLRG